MSQDLETLPLLWQTTWEEAKSKDSIEFFESFCKPSNLKKIQAYKDAVEKLKKFRAETLKYEEIVKKLGKELGYF
ncbi:hypothetical protein [Helicobacter suis]|uniref:hypothetical protein n=1 Tax=Helicobacter suis TaxID=104628 RepID=UPI0022069380|nr:hypothetical protein [Helicobacter suis]BDR29142.1 hypothetical protein HSHS1_19030 [Helicobacter suis HS1]